MKLEIGFMRHDLDNFEETQKMVDYAMSHGQHYFETCYFYLDNQCENFAYKALSKYNRSDYEICGKLPVRNVAEYQGAKNIFKQQLEKVPGHYFDIYLLQALDEYSFHILYKQKIIDFMLEQKRLGNIKRFGLSIQCRPETFKQYLDLGCWDIVQMPLNYYDWFACRANELYNLAKEYNIPIIAQAPMKGGLLADKINVENPTQYALDFIRNLDVEYVLTGCSKLDSYKNTYHCLFETKETKIDLTEYKQKLQDYLNTTYIKCINCGECDKVCPIQLPIRSLVNLYNTTIDINSNYHIPYFNSFDLIKQSIDEPVNRCEYCNQCAEVCPTKALSIHKVFMNMFEMRT